MPTPAAEDLASRFTLGVIPGTQFGAHLGDLADQPQDRESWGIASRAMAKLEEAGVNYSALPGPPRRELPRGKERRRPRR